jgi:hypothetical protein
MINAWPVEPLNGRCHPDQDLIGRHFWHRQFPRLDLFDPPKFIDRYRSHRLI